MKRIKANQIANGYLSEGIDEGINPEYFIADEAQAEIDELVDMLEYFYEYGYARLRVERLLRKHKAAADGAITTTISICNGKVKGVE